MAVVTFDTLKFVKTLEAAGIPPQQAEAMSAAVRDSHETADLVTKSDVDKLSKDVDSKFDLLRLELDSRFKAFDSTLRHEITGVRHEISDVRNELKQLEQRMTIKLGSMLAIAVGLIAAIVKLL
ncbi:MAG: DUF1640 domain-containing protein [Burkholderiaceae bacterium]|nr:DUF1640 domain-containing protein [Burkholderiaceae bacterium]